MRRGLLELAVLNLLAAESTHGYGLASRLAALPGLITTEGTIYPLLSRLRRDGLIEGTLQESPAGPVRKVYGLTAAGRRRQTELNRSWIEIRRSIDGLTRAASPANPQQAEPTGDTP